MKTFFIKLMLSCILCFSVGFTALAQGNRITLDVDNISLPEALRQVERQSGHYKFSYDADNLRAYKVTAKVENATAMDAVRQLVGGLPLSVEEDGKFIRIKPKKVEKAEDRKSPATVMEISGAVFDEESNPLCGATVRRSNGKTLAVTDLEGRFSIKADGETMNLKISYIGMNDVDVKASVRKPVKVIMTPNYTQFNDVVITGYQVLDKRASTSAITSIKAEDIMRPDVMTIDKMLEGQVPDMIFMSNSGEASAAPKIRIRGTSTIIGNREPLWVVDGIVVQDPVPITPDELNDPDYVNRIGNAIAGLNPQDIERLDILKDASATALYGTKAANGVIVITTKRGKEGRPVLRYTNSFTWKLRPRYSDRSVDVMDSKERIQLSRELWDQKYVYASNIARVGYEKAMMDMINGNIDYNQFLNEVRAYETNNTDWFDVLTHDSFSQSHTVSLTGGGSRGSYYSSLGVTDNDDIVKGTKNKRYNAMLNLDIKFSRLLTAKFGIKGSVEDRQYYQSSIAPVQYAYRSSRAIPAFNPDGTYAFYKKTLSNGSFYDYNIANELDNSWVKQKSTNLSFDANFRFRFNDWLTANAIFSYMSVSTGIDSYWGPETYYIAGLRGSEYGEDAPDDSACPQGGELSHQDNTNRAWTGRLQVDWNKYFCDEIHNFSGSLGFEANSNNYNGYSNVSRGYYYDRGMTFVDAVDINKYPNYATWAAGNHPVVTDNKTNKLSAYVSLSYNYDRLFFFNVNARVDGSNKFGDQSNNKLLPIWSISTSIDAKRIPALRDLTWLDYFSVKGSFGYQGNMLDSQSPVMIIRRGSYNSYFEGFTSTVERNPNPGLKWEKTTSYNVGLEWGFFDRMLEIDADFYWKSTRNAFMNKTISTVNGYKSYVVNGGDIDNYGYSAGVSVHPVRNRDWNWSISTNFSRNINKIKSLPAGESFELNDFLNGEAIVKGKAIGTFYSYRFLGLSPVDGGPLFEDYADNYEDLVGLEKYQTYTTVLAASGSREPFMQGSLSSTLRYKNLRFAVNFLYSLGAKTRLFGMYGSGTSGNGGVFAKAGQIKPENNMSRDYLQRWKRPGDERFTNIPAIISQSDYNTYLKYNTHWSTSTDGVNIIANNYWDMYDYSDYRVVSSDYLKLQTLSLFYQFPTEWFARFGISRFELNVAASNLFTICDSKLKGQTPTQGGFSTIELSDRPGFSFGLSVSF